MTSINIASSRVCESATVIGPDMAVRLRFWAYAAETGELLQFGDDLCYLHGHPGGVFPKVEAALAGRTLGERIDVSLAPHEAYGRRDPRLVIVQPKSALPEEAWQPGVVIEGELPDGREVPFTVISVDDAEIELDANHPWAGRALRFCFEVLGLRAGTTAELRTGFPLAAI